MVGRRGGNNSPGAGSYVGAESLQGTPKSPNNFTSTFFNTVNFLLRDLRFEHGSTCFLPRTSSNFVTPLMILIFYSTAARFFCDVTMHIYDNSTALEPHIC